MENTKLVNVQIVHGERVLNGVMEIANGLMANVNQKVCNHQCQIYCKIANSRLSRLVAHLRIFRLLMKGKFDAYVP